MQEIIVKHNHNWSITIFTGKHSMPSKIPCPKCNEYSFHKSHTKTFYEKARKKLIQQQPYRCHKCGYRGWVARSILRPKISLKRILVYIGVFILSILFSILLKNFLAWFLFSAFGETLCHFDPSTDWEKSVTTIF